MAIKLFIFILIVGICTTPVASVDQNTLDYISTFVKVNYAVLNNIKADDKNECRITFSNTGTSKVDGNDWAIFFSHMRMIQPDSQPDPEGTLLGNSGLKVYHVNGYLYKIAAADSSFSLNAGSEIKANFNASWWQIARTDILPNWYVTADGLESRVIANTADDELMFVEPFDTKEKWKRIVSDKYDPYDAAARYQNYKDTKDKKEASTVIIPTPVESTLSSSSRIFISREDWVVYYQPSSLKSEALFLSAKTGLPLSSSIPASRYISLAIGTVTIGSTATSDAEAYTLEVKAEPTDHVTITGTSAAGVFYGIQSLLSLMVDENGVAVGTVRDRPRFAYRGMHLDVGRNFRTKPEVLLLLDAMAMYKLNKFHFHLSDDEGWRLDIPGLQELTTVGGRRCHDPDERSCLSSQLGSGSGSSNSGSGYYTVQDYQDILQYASDRHIQVIPEFDMPGHGHAAIKAMEARYYNLISTNPTDANKYLLSDLNDTSKFLSVQLFTDNAINPCIDSTYEFVRKLVDEVKTMHRGIQNLTIFHFGGDEVAKQAWQGSPACAEYSMQEWNTSSVNNAQLKKRFVERVGEIIAAEGLDMAGWEDGLKGPEGIYDPEDIYVKNSYSYVWNNIWEWGGATAAYEMANANHSVILAHATHLYFDHPQEPDPEERGLYWAPRFTNTGKVFRYMPDDVYANIDFTRMGEPLTSDGVCVKDGQDTCTPLNQKHNIIGIQGALWSEVIRTEQHMHSMVFPRLVALAERAWHKASWEDTQDSDAQKLQQDEDWEQFANTLGYKELGRLEAMGIQYYLPPPGAIFNVDKLQWHGGIPGLMVYSEWGDGQIRLEPGVGERKLTCGIKSVQLHTRSNDLSRRSRSVTVEITVPIPGCTPQTSHGVRPECMVTMLMALVAAIFHCIIV